MYVTRDDASAICLAAMEQQQVTFAALGDAVGRHPVWVAAVVHGQATMAADEAAKLGDLLGVDGDVVTALQRMPTKGSDRDIPADPLLYRFHEINQTFGAAMKSVIHEMFGDGIMSAVDFEIDIAKVEDPKGDRVVVTYNGKFLPYRKF
jgi:cyanate lyase